MALGVEEQRLLAAKGAAHRLANEPGSQGRLGLVGQVFLASKRPAVGHQLHSDSLRVDP